MASPGLNQRWKHNRTGQIAVIVGRPAVKDDSDARWSDGVAYVSNDDGSIGPDMINVQVRKAADFLAKYSQLD